MQKLSKQQAQELIAYINDSKLSTFFEKLDEFGMVSHEI
jgi:hypothetical protein